MMFNWEAVNDGKTFIQQLNRLEKDIEDVRKAQGTFIQDKTFGYVKSGVTGITTATTSTLNATTLNPTTLNADAITTNTATFDDTLTISNYKAYGSPAVQLVPKVADSTTRQKFSASICNNFQKATTGDCLIDTVLFDDPEPGTHTVVSGKYSKYANPDAVKTAYNVPQVYIAVRTYEESSKYFPPVDIYFNVYLGTTLKYTGILPKVYHPNGPSWTSIHEHYTYCGIGQPIKIEFTWPESSPDEYIRPTKVQFTYRIKRCMYPLLEGRPIAVYNSGFTSTESRAITSADIVANRLTYI